MNSVVVLVLAAALIQATGGAMQKHGIATSFPAIGVRDLVARFGEIVRCMFSNWAWIVGGLLVATSGLMLLQALSRADLSAVVPLASTSNLFSIAIGVVLLGERLAPVESLGAAFIVFGAVLVGLDADSASQVGSQADGDLRVLVAVGTLLAFPLAARRVWPGRVSAELSLALAAAFLLGGVNIFGKAATGAVKQATGGFDALTGETLRTLAVTPEFYLCVLANVCAFVFMQLAFANGRVAIVVPVLAAGSTLVGSLAGFMLLEEVPRALRVAGIGTLVGGTCLLTALHRRAPAASGQNSRSTPRSTSAEATQEATGISR